MIEHIKKFIEVITSRNKSTGMTFIRKFGGAQIPGKEIVVFVTMVAVPKNEAQNINSEWHSPTVAACGYADDVVVIAVSTGEGKDISQPESSKYFEGSRGLGIESVLRAAIWKF